MAASYFSLAPLPVDGFDSHSSSSSGWFLTPESADFTWHFTTAVVYFASALDTPSSHFPVAGSGGMKPLSSRVVEVVVVLVEVVVVTGGTVVVVVVYGQPGSFGSAV